jgi:hypothetical protein
LKPDGVLRTSTGSGWRMAGGNARSLGASAREVLEELRGVLAGRSALIDTLIPPALFLALASPAGLTWAAGAALASAAGLGLWRLGHGASPLYAALGLAGAGLAAGASSWPGAPRGWCCPTW